jgi:lipoprotein-anchoring transpeptidase ErfK/SrfK
VVVKQRIVLRTAIVLLVIGGLTGVVLVARNGGGGRPSAKASADSGAHSDALLQVGRQPSLFPQAPAPPSGYLAADAVVPAVAYFTNVGDPQPAGVATNPTINGGPLVFRVLEDKGDWLHVEISKRPNGTTGWIQRTDVALREVANRVVVALGARKLSVFNGDQQLVMETTVAIGRPSAPTPVGSFFIEGSFPTGSSGGAYGVLILTVSAFSDVYQTFAGGIGQIGIHGTNAPQLLGQAVSHGCVRMTNADVTQLNQLAPPGTPVDIVA